MKKVLLTTAVAVSLFAWGGGMGMGKGRGGGNCQQQQQLNSPAYNKVYDLSEAQKEALKYMYEEEKLARDVYITLGNKWQLKPFLNIQKSEQMHMDSVKRLLDKYNIPVNVNNSVGSFTIPEMTALYNELVSKGLKSEKDALEVGKIVEITDIKDLDERMANATPDMQMVFSRLRNGSEHHLAAFNRFLSIY